MSSYSGFLQDPLLVISDPGITNEDTHYQSPPRLNRHTYDINQLSRGITDQEKNKHMVGYENYVEQILQDRTVYRMFNFHWEISNEQYIQAALDVINQLYDLDKNQKLTWIYHSDGVGVTLGYYHYTKRMCCCLCRTGLTYEQFEVPLPIRNA